MEIDSSVEGVRLFQQNLFDFCSGLHLGRDTAMKINLAVEEILINIISHAYTQNGSQKIFINFEHDGRQIKITIRDMGPPFDINAAPEAKPVESSVDKIGGWGIFIVRNIMDKVEYIRTKESNIVSLIKNV